jgi:hypothetical protein
MKKAALAGGRPSRTGANTVLPPDRTILSRPTELRHAVLYLAEGHGAVVPPRYLATLIGLIADALEAQQRRTGRPAA